MGAFRLCVARVLRGVGCVKRWTPGVVALWRGEGNIQIGSDPRTSFVLEGLSPAEQRLVEMLARDVGVPVDPGLLTRQIPALEPERAQAIVTALVQAEVLVDLVPTPRHSARQAARIVVVGGDDLGLRIATVLATAGLGGVCVIDNSPVESDDVAPGGYLPRDRGLPRGQQAVGHLRAACATLTTSLPARPSLIVLVESRVAVPFRSAAYVREDIAHLSVVRRERDIVVGPSIRPGLDPCLRCLDLHRTNADPTWPNLATQLATAPPAPTDLGSVSIAAGLAANLALALVDGVETEADRGVTLEVDPLTPIPRQRRWAPHPLCGCGAHRALRGGEVSRPALANQKVAPFTSRGH